MKTFLAIAAIFVIVLGVQVAGAIAIHTLIPNLADRAQFGDSFGAINALFSGLAFAGLIYTILMQRKELQLQREELQLTRSEISRSAEAQEKSERALSKQALAAQVAAEIAAINNLLAYVDGEVRRLNGGTTDRIVNRDALEKLAIQRTNLVKNLNDLYSTSVAARYGS